MIENNEKKFLLSKIEANTRNIANSMMFFKVITMVLIAVTAVYFTVLLT